MAEIDAILCSVAHAMTGYPTMNHSARNGVPAAGTVQMFMILQKEIVVLCRLGGLIERISSLQHEDSRRKYLAVFMATDESLGDDLTRLKEQRS